MDRAGKGDWLNLALHIALGLALGMAVPIAAAQSSAHADAMRQYDIPAGPLSRALSAWGAQSGSQLVFAPDLVAAKTSKPVSGRYTAAQALDRLLSGSGLAWERTGDATVVLRKAPPPKPARRAAPTVSDAAQAPEPQTLERLLVTGSNIPRGDLETASPVQVITRQEIDRTGKSNLADYLQGLTADGQGSIPKTFGSGFAAGGTALSLRGLGASNTLILVNGRRMASFGLADDGQKLFTDLSTIPLEAVERIEVLKDGGSAIYGSDAIAGTVNIILRQEAPATVVKAGYGVSGEGDAQTRSGSILTGSGDLAKDGYSVFLSIEGTREDGLRVSDRRDRKWIGSGDWRRWGYRAGEDLLSGVIPPEGAAQASPVGAVERAPGDWVSLPGCSKLSDVVPQDPGGGCLWDPARFRDLTPESRSINIYSHGSFAISDTAELYAELSYARKRTHSITTPSSVSGLWGPVNASSGAGAVRLGADHPDNPYGAAVRLRYSAFDVGPRTNSTDNALVRVLVGTKGTAGAWDYDLGYSHSQSDFDAVKTGYLHYDRVRQVLTDPQSPVGYWRLGVNADLNSRALYDYISPRLRSQASTELDTFDAKASRSLVELRGGPLGLALGMEARRQAISLEPTTLTETSQIIGMGYNAYDGVEQVSAVYGELRAPLSKSLELSGAVRVDKYRNYKAIATPKLGVKWRALSWMALRATYSEAVRAPSPIEAGNGGLSSFTSAQDPIRCPDNVPAPGANPGDCLPQTVAIFIAPNRDLKPERARYTTVGLVLDPTPTTSVTLDFFRVRRTDEILTQDFGAEVLKNGGNVRRDDNDLPGRPHTGSLLGVEIAYTNADSTIVQGFDLDARQRFELGDAGELRLDLQWTRMNSFERDTGGIRTEYAGTHGDCNVTNCIGIPKDRINLGLTWDAGTWSLSGLVNYRGKLENTLGRTELAYDDDGNLIRRRSECGSKFANGEDAPRGCVLASFYTVDLSGTWKPREAWELFGSVQNVTDRIAPLDPLTYGASGYNPLDYSGAIGRYYTVGVKYAF
ncbi:TonB-dependent receptor [Luteimonas aquatica]|uniref:TonB-dependent receptor n=1 Tax=Luteimonas aquatica TaxID=450364 RepID=UPI001F594CFB|nr:TonB-dependent receptor [Luteimonas aquatica]